MKGTTLHLELDVHMETITAAAAEGEVRVIAAISNALHAVKKLLGRLRRAHPESKLNACYEAGLCGFGIARRLGQIGAPDRRFPASSGSLSVSVSRPRFLGRRLRWS